jgi:predicted Zn-dependent peptidase
MSLNRSQAPSFNVIDNLVFPHYENNLLSNGISFYQLKAGTEPVIRLDFVFTAGMIHQAKKGQAFFTASMLSEGTKTKSAQALADALDYYGSYFQVRSNTEDTVATLYCLDKHLENCLSIFIEALSDSIFPKKELEIQKKNSIQKLLVSLKKNNYLCRKGFYTHLLGEGHPYASFSEKQDIEAINIDDLKAFHQKYILNGLNYVMLSGNFSLNSAKIIASAVENSAFLGGFLEPLNIQPKTNIGKHFLEKADSVQSAIKIGKITISRNHPDFRKLQFLNLIFGGYFGSRLMKNIREDKGLTYGIYSALEPFKKLGVWYIDSDINTKNRQLGIEEIYKEMKLLRTELIKNDEFETAKNYYLGSFLRSLDGPFSIADRLKIIIDNSLPNDYYPEFVGVLNTTTPEELMKIAQEYFTEENLVEMVVGQK